MGTGRKFNKAPVVRPKKKGGERRRRDKVQSLRLVALGHDAETVRKMVPGDRRKLLRRPTPIAAAK